MNTSAIDEAINKYVADRMKKGKKRASERFLSYAYLRFAGDELGEFMKNVRGLSRYYMDFLKVMENPFKGPELPWFASMITILVVSCFMLASEEWRTSGIFIFSATVVALGTLLRETAKKWRELEVLIAIYREIAELADCELCNK